MVARLFLKPACEGGQMLFLLVVMRFARMRFGRFPMHFRREMGN